jgi:hypothetical protein
LPYTLGMSTTPEWIASQRKARGLCECCGQEPAVTEWAGTGQDICWTCVDKKRADSKG